MVREERPIVKNSKGRREPIAIDWDTDAVAWLVKCADALDGGIRELKNIITRAALYSHFERKSVVSKDEVEKALAQRLPSQGARSSSAVSSATWGIDKRVPRVTVEVVVETIKERLKEMGVVKTTLVGKNVKTLEYTEIGAVLTKDQGTQLAKWVQKDSLLKKKRGDEETEANFLAALGYTGTNRNPRGTIYGNWMKRSGSGE